MNDYFAVSHAIEAQLNETMPEIEKVCSYFTANDPKELAKYDVTAHINMAASQFGNESGHGLRQAEVQRWQVSLCFKSPRNETEEAELREKAGAMLLQLRQALQGFCPEGLAKPLTVEANHTYLTADCRFRVFGFTFAAAVII